MKPEECRSRRQALGWSLEKLAGEADVSTSLVHRFETGQTEPHRNNLQALELALRLGERAKQLYEARELR